MPTNVSAILQGALRELEAERHRVERQITAIQGVLGRDEHFTERAARWLPKQSWSAAARAAVGRRMKAYWAKRRAEHAKAAAGKSGPRRTARKKVAKASRKGRRASSKKKAV